MPSENSGSEPAGNSDTVSPPVENQPMGNTGPLRTNGQHEDTENLAKEVHWIQHATFWSQVGLGLIGIAALCIYHGQFDTMNKTYKEIINQTYDACLNAQTAQATLLQIQRSAEDSHAAALATIKQTTAGIEAERSLVSITPRPPQAEELVGQQLVIPYSVKNDGKSTAVSTKFKMVAVILSEKEILRISDKEAEILEIKYLPAGGEIPNKSENPQQRPVVEVIAVKDSKGNGVPVSSQEAQDFLTGGGNEMVFFYGSIEYSDFSGNHNSRFCYSVYTMKPRTSRKMWESETDCAKYNHQDDRYTAMPNMSTLPPKAAAQISPVNCTEPKN